MIRVSTEAVDVEDAVVGDVVASGFVSVVEGGVVVVPPFYKLKKRFCSINTGVAVSEDFVRSSCFFSESEVIDSKRMQKHNKIIKNFISKE